MKEKSQIQGENNQVAGKKKAEWEDSVVLICEKNIMDYLSFLLRHKFQK